MPPALTFRTLRLYKEAFHTDGVDANFPKFHFTLHHPSAIRKFGSVRVCDAGAGERLHKVEVKPLFQKTSKQRRRYLTSMYEKHRTLMCLRWLALEYVKRPTTQVSSLG